MITEYVFGIETPGTFLLVLKDPDQDLVEREGASGIIVLTFRGTASVIDRPTDRDGSVLDV